MSNRPGFLLIEIIIALALLSGVASIIAYHQWYACAWTREARVQLAAVNAARDTLEQCLLHHTLRQREGVVVRRIRAPQPRSSMYALSDQNFVMVQAVCQWQSVFGDEKKTTISTGMVVA